MPNNDALNRAAFSLGQLVGGGLPTEGEVEQALLSAAFEVGQPLEGEAMYNPQRTTIWHC